MSLEVNIEKKLDGFTLRAAFSAGNTPTALLGASGCGKSMTLRCIAGIVKPDKGRIVLDGRVLFDSEQHIDLPPQQRGAGLLFQNYALFQGHCTVKQIGSNIIAVAFVQDVLLTFYFVFKAAGQNITHLLMGMTMCFAHSAFLKARFPPHHPAAMGKDPAGDSRSRAGGLNVLIFQYHREPPVSSFSA